MPQEKLHIVPLELREANAFVEEHHRHHGRAQGHRFSIGVVNASGELAGCAIVGRPTSGLDPKRILEITRLCTNGTPNACSALYGAVVRAAKALGYARVQTYIYEEESGVSLRAAGWHFERPAHPSGRHRKRSDGEARDLTHVAKRKTLWVRDIMSNDEPWAHHRRKG